MREMGDNTAGAEWQQWSTTMQVVVTNPAMLDDATALVRDVLADVGAACDRFDPMSELQRIQSDAALDTAGVVVSDTLAMLVRTALDAARMTEGDVDPTLGVMLAGLGYDRSFERLNDPARPESAALGGVPVNVPIVVSPPRVPGWQRVRLDGNRLTVPADLRLDLGATAKARAADLAAARVFERLGCGVLVSLGGDIATAGPAPSSSGADSSGQHSSGQHSGWQITVCDLPGDPSSQITLAAGQALATSSTQKRRWQRDGRQLHHILDPSSALPAAPVWRTVTVAAPSCVRANMVSTASVVRGYRAIAWLARRGTTARLVNHDRRVLTLGGWPDDNSVHVLQAG